MARAACAAVLVAVADSLVIFDDPARTAVRESFKGGDQLCTGKSPPDIDQKKVALMMIGQAFRTKDYKTNGKQACNDESEEVQQALVQNHLLQVVEPFEAEGFQVDIFLVNAHCGVTHPDLTLETDSRKDRLFSDKLVGWYGAKRVVAGIDMAPNRGQFYHVSEMLREVQNHTIHKGKSYRYLVGLRYDMMVTFSINDVAAKRTKLSATGAGLADSPLGLDYFFSADDYLWGYPGGFANCMVQLFDECLAPCKFNDCSMTDGLSRSSERNPKCYEFGPIVATSYNPRRGGYVLPLLNIAQALRKLDGSFVVQGHGEGVFTKKNGIERCAAFCDNPEYVEGYAPFYYKIVLA